MIKPFLLGLKPTLHISHRGGAALAPENTLEAFRGAMERYQTDMLELDVRLTRDGVVVVSHDATTGRCCDRDVQIAATMLRDLQQLDAGHRFTPDAGATFPFRGRGIVIPTLQEVLRAFPDMRMNIELKTALEGLVEAFVAVIRGEKAVERVCVGSEQDDVAARLFKAMPEACHFYPREALTTFSIALKMGIDPTGDNRYDVLDMPAYYQGERLIDPGFVESVRGAGKWVNVWTVDDADEMRRLIKDGVGGIMTDRPDVLRDVLSGK
ncbi:MAG TPA: glycerophosphodiester phosphodiesterase [Myxococcales bacterium]|nr:glycerophosphodiester phosphodiesterase [Myxococcales bacterium]